MELKIINCPYGGLKNLKDICKPYWHCKGHIKNFPRFDNPTCENCIHGTVVTLKNFPTIEDFESTKELLKRIQSNEWDKISLEDIENAQKILCNVLQSFRNIE